MDKVEGIGYSVSGVSAVMTALQSVEIFQIISFCGTIACCIATLIYTSIKIYREIKKDGVITEEEKQGLFKHIFSGIKDICVKIFSKTKKKGDKEDGTDIEN